MPTEIKKEEAAPILATETVPAEIAPSEVITESKKIETPETETELKEKTPTEPKPETERTEPNENSLKVITTESNQTPRTPPDAPAKNSIFEPIIITVPKAEIKPIRKPSETGESRPRLVAEAEEPEPILPCKILVNQETASIISGGGNLALIAEIVGDGEIKDIKAKSSSPADVEAAFDSEIGGLTKRGLFVVKSLSEKRGIFTVTFELPCGKKDVSVSVR